MGSREMALGAALTLLSQDCCAQWTAVSLHQSGWTYSEVYAVHGTGQGGVAWRREGKATIRMPSLWSGSPGSFTDLQAPGEQYALVRGMADGIQVGEYVPPDPFVGRAALWRGTPESRVELHPQGAYSSRAMAVAGDIQAGEIAYLAGGAQPRAGYWRGTAESWTSVHPPGALYSWARATDGTLLGGRATYAGGNAYPMLWTLGGEMTNLTPAGSVGGEITGMAPGQQVGNISMGPGDARCGLWSGTAQSWVDLTPHPGLSSYLYGTSGTAQVGMAGLPGNTTFHAGIWFGTRESFIDLHQYLPPGYSASVALAVTELNGTYIVGGYAVTSGVNREAFIWVGVPTPAAGAVLAIASLWSLRRQRPVRLLRP